MDLSLGNISPYKQILQWFITGWPRLQELSITVDKPSWIRLFLWHWALAHQCFSLEKTNASFSEITDDWKVIFVWISFMIGEVLYWLWVIEHFRMLYIFHATLCCMYVCDSFWMRECLCQFLDDGHMVTGLAQARLPSMNETLKVLHKLPGHSCMRAVTQRQTVQTLTCSMMIWPAAGFTPHLSSHPPTLHYPWPQGNPPLCLKPPGQRSWLLMCPNQHWPISGQTLLRDSCALV